MLRFDATRGGWRWEESDGRYRFVDESIAAIEIEKWLFNHIGAAKWRSRETTSEPLCDGLRIIMRGRASTVTVVDSNGEQLCMYYRDDGVENLIAALYFIYCEASTNKVSLKKGPNVKV